MSLSLNSPGRPKAHAPKTRKLIIATVLLLSLILGGTILVLSFVSYYLAIPTAAFLTEAEVPWNPNDAIPLLRDPPSIVSDLEGLRVRRSTKWGRQEWEEIDGEGTGDGVNPATATKADDAIMGADTIAEVWSELEEDIAAGRGR